MPSTPPPRLQQPPRAVPLRVVLRLLLGGVLAQLGWFFVFFGSFFVWIFVPFIDWAALDGWNLMGPVESGFPPTVVVCVIFPIAGLAMAAIAFREGLRQLRLLRQGLLGQGHFEYLVPTGTTIKINNSGPMPVMRVRLAYKTRSGRGGHAVVSTHEPALLAVLQEPGPQPVLYLEEAPEAAVPFWALAGLVDVEADGTLRSATLLGGLISAVLPLLCLVIHGRVAYGFLQLAL